MDPKIYIPVIAALAGALVGALIKELASFYHAYREDQRTLKVVLFNQLDVWYEVRRCDTRPLILTFFEKIKQRIAKEGASTEQIDELLEKVRPQIEALLKRVKIGDPEKLQQRYQASVDNLAQVDPILAYRLSGKPNLENTQSKLDAYLDGAMKLGSSQTADEIVKGFRDHVGLIYKEKLLKRVIEALEKDIRSVARRISLITRIRAARTLRELEEKVKSEFTSEADKMLDLMIDYFRSAPKTPGA
jgi:hypothetical protein